MSKAVPPLPHILSYISQRQLYRYVYLNSSMCNKDKFWKLKKKDFQEKLIKHVVCRVPVIIIFRLYMCYQFWLS
jgi:hypothetical protein